MKKKEDKLYIPLAIAILIIAVIFGKDLINVFNDEFNDDLKELNEINSDFDTNFYSFPETNEDNGLLLMDLNGLNDDKNSEPIQLVIDIRAKLVESDIFFKEGWKYGRGSTTIYGFGCSSGLPRIRETTANRNMSSLIGFEALNLMNELIEKYPKEAEAANITAKQVLFLNASFYSEIIEASKDRKFIERLCLLENETGDEDVEDA